MATQNARAASLPATSSVHEVAHLTSARGTKYRIFKTDELDPYEKPLAPTEMATLGAQRLTPGDDFAGTDRKDAKLSIVNAKTETFGELQLLLKSLTADSSMIKHKPPLTRDPHFQRVKEEQRNVRVRAFLYAASQEADNDFHFIVGRDPKSPAMYMNMELSGLPPTNAPSFARLKAARDAFKAFIGANLPGPGYHHYDPPIPIDVEGSLFFDITHATGQHPGPAKLRPQTIWEVHPISHIVFEP
jgi:hypothetical protein